MYVSVVRIDWRTSGLYYHDDRSAYRALSTCAASAGSIYTFTIVTISEGMFSHEMDLVEGVEAYRLFDSREDDLAKIMMIV